MLLCPFSVSVAISILLMKVATLPLLIIFLKRLFIMAWKVASKFVSPKYITVGSNDPRYVINTVFHSFSSLI